MCRCIGSKDAAQREEFLPAGGWTWVSGGTFCVVLPAVCERLFLGCLSLCRNGEKCDDGRMHSYSKNRKCVRLCCGKERCSLFRFLPLYLADVILTQRSMCRSLCRRRNGSVAEEESGNAAAAASRVCVAPTVCLVYNRQTTHSYRRHACRCNVSSLVGEREKCRVSSLVRCSSVVSCVLSGARRGGAFSLLRVSEGPDVGSSVGLHEEDVSALCAKRPQDKLGSSIHHG